MRPIPVSAGAAATHARPPRARAAARTAGRAASPAARQAAFCRYGFLPPPLTGPRVACVPCQAPGCGKRILTRRVVPFLLAAMAGGAWRGNSAIYVGAFCGNEEGGFRAPFQGSAEAGYRATGKRAYSSGAYSGMRSLGGYWVWLHVGRPAFAGQWLSLMIETNVWRSSGMSRGAIAVRHACTGVAAADGDRGAVRQRPGRHRVHPAGVAGDDPMASGTADAHSWKAYRSSCARSECASQAVYSGSGQPRSVTSDR
jgi:hypothetical protein